MNARAGGRARERYSGKFLFSVDCHDALLFYPRAKFILEVYTNGRARARADFTRLEFNKSASSRETRYLDGNAIEPPGIIVN